MLAITYISVFFYLYTRLIDGKYMYICVFVYIYTCNCWIINVLFCSVMFYNNFLKTIFRLVHQNVVTKDKHCHANPLCVILGILLTCINVLYKL